MKRIISAFLALVLTVGSVCALTACRGREGEISVLYYTYSDTYISSVRSQMDAYLDKAGLKHHNYDAGGNQTTQTEQVDTAITKGSRLLIVNVVDTGSRDAAQAIVAKAKNAGIPLIFFNRSVDEDVIKSYDKCVFVGTDYEMAGRLQGEMIGNYVKDNYQSLDINGDGKISYVMFKGQQGNAEAEARTALSVEGANAILTEAGLPSIVYYDSRATDKYLVDQDGAWSNAAANNYMKTILSGYSESGGNMVELVIANNDEMALGALAALEEAGYNKQGKRTIPVFGVDATEAAKTKIRAGAMTGTVRQDAEGMAVAIGRIAENMLLGREMLDGIAENDKASEVRVNIPYSVYTAKENE